MRLKGNFKPFSPEPLINPEPDSCAGVRPEGNLKAAVAAAIRSDKNTCSYAYVRSIGRPNYGDCQPYVQVFDLKREQLAGRLHLATLPEELDPEEGGGGEGGEMKGEEGGDGGEAGAGPSAEGSQGQARRASSAAAAGGQGAAAAAAGRATRAASTRRGPFAVGGQSSRYMSRASSWATTVRACGVRMCVCDWAVAGRWLTDWAVAGRWRCVRRACVRPAACARLAPARTHARPRPPPRHRPSPPVRHPWPQVAAEEGGEAGDPSYGRPWALPDGEAAELMWLHKLAEAEELLETAAATLAKV
jgi:hypothetical protein